jgi:putative DNA primase/helicase
MSASRKETVGGVKMPPAEENGIGPAVTSNGTPTKPKPAAAPAIDGGHHLTDLGNARRVLDRHGKDLRYVHPWRTWLVWDGRRWAVDMTGRAVRRVKETQGALFQDITDRMSELRISGGENDAAPEQAAVVRLLKHALKWEDARALTRSLELLRSEPDIPLLPEDLDQDPYVLNVLNGTLDLRTGELGPHCREDLLSKLAPVKYHANAQCPQWQKFLDRIMDCNERLITYLQRVAGYSLTGSVAEQCLWFLYGTGANGKSTFLHTLRALLGDYAMQAVSELLMVKANESHPTERADLFGKRFVATIETEEGKKLAEALMKQMTGGDNVRARKMKQDFFEFSPTHKIFLAANHKPVIRGTDCAVWRRIKLVPFTVTIPEGERDKDLLDKLRSELPGILNWCLRGCLDWQKDRSLGEPEDVRHATEVYQSEQDVLQSFLVECCNDHPEAKVKASALFGAYQDWSGDRQMSLQTFGQRLRDRGLASKRSSSGYFWHGIALRSDLL